MNLTNEAKLASEKRTFVFHRLYEGKPFFYTVHIPKDTVADNAECNPGTLKVEDALTGEIVWTSRKEPQ